MNFRGTFEHALDAKHRLTVPARYRTSFAAGVVLAVSPSSEEGTPNAVAMWTPEAFDEYTESALKEYDNPLSATAQKLSRLLSANSYEVELDAANRVMLPQQLMDFGGLDKEVVVIGARKRLEIWDRAAYTAYNARELAAFAEITRGLDHHS